MLQVDGYAGFERLTLGGDIVLAACWAHTRRKFYEFHQATGSPIAAGVLRRIAELYAIEREIRGQSAEQRQSIRDIRSRPLVDAMKPWLEGQLYRVPPRGGLAEAIRYALARWPALCRFLDDGRDEEMPPEIKDDLQAELKRLRKENAVLRQERDILKKAAAFFAKEGSR